MKYVQYIIMVCLSLCLKAIAFSQSIQVILNPVDPTVSEAQLKQASETMKERLNILNIKLQTIDLQENPPQLQLTIDDDINTNNMSLLIRQKGDLSFRETVTASVFLESIPNDDPFLEYLKDKRSIEFPSASAIIVEVNLKEVDLVMQHINRLEQNGNLDKFELAWGVPDDNSKIRLYALSKHQDLKIDRGDIDQIDLPPSIDGLGTDISMTFSDGGSQKWAEMTRTHINQVIAIMLDDMVLMAPKVVEEITGGKMQLNGLWGDGGDKVLYAILKTKMLSTYFDIQP